MLRNFTIVHLRSAQWNLELPTDRGDNHVPQQLIDALTSWIAIFNQDPLEDLHQNLDDLADELEYWFAILDPYQPEGPQLEGPHPESPHQILENILHNLNSRMAFFDQDQPESPPTEGPQQESPQQPEIPQQPEGPQPEGPQPEGPHHILVPLIDGLNSLIAFLDQDQPDSPQQPEGLQHQVLNQEGQQVRRSNRLL